MAQEWHVQKNGVQQGPFPLEELQQWVQSGRLLPADRVWTKGMADWGSAGEAQELFPAQSAQSPTDPLPGSSLPDQTPPYTLGPFRLDNSGRRTRYYPRDEESLSFGERIKTIFNYLTFSGNFYTREPGTMDLSRHSTVFYFPFVFVTLLVAIYYTAGLDLTTGLLGNSNSTAPGLIENVQTESPAPGQATAPVDIGESKISLQGEWAGTITFQQHKMKTLSIGSKPGFEEMIAQAIKEFFILMFDEMTGVPLELYLSFGEPDGDDSEICRAATKIVIPARVNDEISRKWIEKEKGPADPFQPPMTNTKAVLQGSQVSLSTLFFEPESGTTFASQPKLDLTGAFSGPDALHGAFLLHVDGEEIGRGVWECRRK